MTDFTKSNKTLPESPDNLNPKSVEKLFIWAILVFGIVGLLVVLDNMTYKKNETAGTSIYKDAVNVLYQTDKESVSIPKVLKEKIKEKQLHIGGPLEAHTPVLFKVENFHQDVEYLLDFGDGIRRVLNQRTDSHIYEKPGNYKLELYGTYKGERVKLASNKVFIMEPITVAANATRIDF